MNKIKYPQKLTDLRRFVNAVKKYPEVESIILTGSASYNEYVEGWSDIDLMVITDTYPSFQILSKDKYNKPIYTREEIFKHFEEKTPLSVFISCGKYLYKRKNAITPYNFEVDAKYKKLLMEYAVYAYELLKYQKTNKKKLRQIHHALRHILRCIYLNLTGEYLITEDGIILNIPKVFKQIFSLTPPKYLNFILKAYYLFLEIVIIKHKKINVTNKMLNYFKEQFEMILKGSYLIK